MKQYEINSLYHNGLSFRKIAQRLDVDQKTVGKFCHRYQEGLEAVIHSQLEKKLEETTHQVVSSHQYNTKNRTTRTFSPEVYQLIREIYQQEKIKNQRLGPHKQGLLLRQAMNSLPTQDIQLGITQWRTLSKAERKTGKLIFVKNTH